MKALPLSSDRRRGFISTHSLESKLLIPHRLPVNNFLLEKYNSIHHEN